MKEMTNKDNNGKKYDDYSSLIIVLLVSTVFIILAYIFFLPHHTLQAADCNKTDIANAMMIELNAINNILTWGSFIIATLTIIAAVFGIVGFVEFKKSVNKDVEKIGKITTDFTTKINSFIKDSDQTIEDYKNDIKNKILEIESFKSTIIAQVRYFNKSLEYLYTVSSILIDKDGNDELGNFLYHDLNIISLYRYEPSDNNDVSSAILQAKKEAIENLKDIGTLDDIVDLEIIVQNEPNEEIKRKIQELIGIIKHNFNMS